jgi:uncharacterized protein YfaS (alpha-2-macroglobulin family)
MVRTGLPILLFVVLIAGMLGVTRYYARLPENLSQHETILLGRSRFVPGSQSALRILVRDSRNASPLPGAEIQVSLKPIPSDASSEAPGVSLAGPVVLYSGKTDPQGQAAVSFHLPEQMAGRQTLVVETRSSLGSDRLEQEVTLERDYRVLLSSDKPLYQPGQVIHLRALALSTFDLVPASGQALEFVIADGKGNKVFRKELLTSAYGIAAVDFQLASEVNTGPYKIQAVMENTTSETTVQVERYVLPKFSIDLETERSFYLPGETVNGTLQASYFFGKPVSQGQVTLEGYTFDVEKTVVVSLQGTTDEEGGFQFSFALPAYIAGTDLEGGAGRFYLQAVVKDLTSHSEVSNLSLPVASSGLVIEAIPESGKFRPGVENILYVLTSYPDGTPAETELRVTFQETGQAQTVETGPYGMAEILYTPANPYQGVAISARDLHGARSDQEFYFEGEWAEEAVILRPERPVYRVGETMNLTLLASQPQGTVYLDIVREGQTMSTRAVEIHDGKGLAAVDLTPELYGTLELHAYKVLTGGAITRDTRLVVVDPADDLQLAFAFGRDGCQPGSTAGLEVQVSSAQGQGTQAAVGLAVVDESVFALAEQDPGFARLYFLLEAELLRPKYDLHGFSIPQMVGRDPLDNPAEDPVLLKAQQGAAQAALAEVSARASSFTVNANSHQQAMNRAYQQQSRFFQVWTKGLFGVLLVLPLAAIGASVVSLRRERRLGRSLVVVLVLAYGITLAFFRWPMDEFSSSGNSPLDRLSILLNRLPYEGQGWILAAVLAGLAGLVAWTIMAIIRKNRLLALFVGLLAGYLVLLGAVIYSAPIGSLYPSTAWTVVFLISYAAFILAILLRSTGYALQRQTGRAVAGSALAFFLLVGALPAAYSMTNNGIARRGLAGADGGIVEEKMAMGAVPAMAPAGAMPTQALPLEDQAGNQTAAPSQGREPPRLRQYFPETMFWLPEAVTDPQGRLHLDLPVADSITTWRLTGLASSQSGQLGSATGSLRVFQDFFVDLDLPLALTVGDEVSVPVGVFNYLPDAQTVRLELQAEDWFELLDEPVKTLDIGSNDIQVVTFRIRAADFGRQPFQVTAYGSVLSDAIRKEVQVYPNGKPVNFTFSEPLKAGTPVDRVVSIPAEAIPGTQNLWVKIYPGIFSQVVEGLDGILRMPYGCFEQTSSTTYPNVLVLDYLKSTGQASPESQLKAEEYINLGYQRLATFEVDGGGFSLFSDAPADRMLTAYGLQEFSDMNRVYPVDEAIISRAADWLLSSQMDDGSWENDQGLVHESTWSSLGNDRLPVTAYIVWSLIEAGRLDAPGTQKGLDYLREFQAQAEDAYVVALLANAFAAADLAGGSPLNPATITVLERLAGLAVMDGDMATWKSGVATFTGAEGQTGSIETTALAAYALLRANRFPDVANAALAALVSQKDSFGTWYSTQATVLTLKALLQSVRTGEGNLQAEVTIHLNGGQTRTVSLTPENFDVVQLVQFDDVLPGADNRVTIEVEGQGNLMYQISGGYYIPWDKLDRIPQPETPGEDLVDIDVVYDRTELEVDDTVIVDVTVTLHEGQAESALIDLGIPPGFSVVAEDLQSLVIRDNDQPKDYPGATIQRFEMTGRQVLVYIENLAQGQPLQFQYRLQARFPLVAQAPASQVYDYYNPEVSGESLPQILVVAE